MAKLIADRPILGTISALERLDLAILFLMMVGLAMGCATETPAPPGITLEGLPGTGWRLASLEDENGAMQVLDHAEITLAFDDQGRVVGSGGCNRYFGGIELTAEGKLSIGPLGSTRMACGDVPDDREFRFLRALESCDIVTGSEGHLELLSHDGVVRIVFDEAPDVAAEAS